MSRVDPVTAAKLTQLNKKLDGLGGSGCSKLQPIQVNSADPISQGNEIWFTPGTGIQANQDFSTEGYSLINANNTGNVISSGGGVLGPSSDVNQGDISPDGSTMIVCDGNEIRQINLPTAGSIVGATSSGTITNPATGALCAVRYSDSGNLLMVMTQDERIESFTLSVPYDILSTVTATGEVLTGLPTINGDLAGFDVSDAGDRLVVCGFATNNVRQYNMSANALGSATLAYDVAIGPSTPRDVWYSEDGSLLMIYNSSDVFKYSLSTNYEINVSTDTGEIISSTGGTNARGMIFYNAGDKFFNVQRFSITEYDSLTLTILNTSSVVVGTATETAAPATDFTALIDSCGKVSWTGVVTGDTLNEQAGVLAINGPGALVGFCVNNDELITFGIGSKSISGKTLIDKLGVDNIITSVTVTATNTPIERTVLNLDIDRLSLLKAFKVSPGVFTGAGAYYIQKLTYVIDGVEFERNFENEPGYNVLGLDHVDEGTLMPLAEIVAEKSIIVKAVIYQTSNFGSRDWTATFDLQEVL